MAHGGLWPRPVITPADDEDRSQVTEEAKSKAWRGTNPSEHLGPIAFRGEACPRRAGAGGAIGVVR